MATWIHILETQGIRGLSQLNAMVKEAVDRETKRGWRVVSAQYSSQILRGPSWEDDEVLRTMTITFSN